MITSGASGTGNGTVNYSIAANTGVQRVGTMTISGQTFTVTQAATPLLATNYIISTLAGGMNPPPTLAPATSVSLPVGYGIASDPAGNVYFSSPALGSIFRVDGTGVLTRIAGTGVAGYSGDSGAAIAAQLNFPYGVALDAVGNLYIADTSNNRIRKISVSGVITTVAGNGNCCYSGDGGAATSAYLNNPYGVAVDSAGNVYIADTNNNRIRKVNTSGIISTVAGTGAYGYSGDGGAATSAQLSNPQGVAVDSAGNIYIADFGNQRVRMVAVSTGNIVTVAGNGNGGCSSGDGGLATSATIQNPVGVAVDSTGNLYIAATNCAVRSVDTSGVIHAVAGTCGGGYTGDGVAATSTELRGPSGVAIDAAGNIYISDYVNQRIRKVSTAGTITTIAGGATMDGGPGALAGINNVSGVTRDASGNIYIADTNNNRIRKLDGNGVVSTYAGTGLSGYAGDSGAAASAQLNQPHAAAADSAGNLYIADTANNRIRKIDTSGNITTVAGNGNCCSALGDGGAATSATLNAPNGVAVDSAGNLYIADTSNSRVRIVTTAGTITTFAGTGSGGYSGDGGAATSAQLLWPDGVALDSTGNLYVADSGNNRIRKVDTSGNISTVAGTGTCCYSGDGGAATSAQLNYPTGVTVDSLGNLYIADDNNLRIRKVVAGTISTIAGRGGSGDSGDGAAAINATFRSPFAVAVDSSGYVYVADQSNNAVRLLTPIGTTPVLTIQSAHTGSFTQGQSGAAYTVTVTNAATAGATSGTVTVTESLPTGLTLASLAGAGWACTVSSATCTRADALSGGSSYPVIVVTVNVAAAAPAQLSNQVTCVRRRRANGGSHRPHYHCALQRSGGAGFDRAC